MTSSESFDITSGGERRVVRIVSPATANEAVQQIESCASCAPYVANILFDSLLGDITGFINNDESPVHHILVPTACPGCGDTITEESLVKRKDRS